MKKSMMGIMMFALTATGTTACATKGFVKSQVSQVSSKVDSLSQSLEETQERTKQNEARIGEVDQKAGVAQSSADKAGTAAGDAGAKALAAGDLATTAGNTATAAATKADAVDKASKRIVYEVVLNDSEGNFKFGNAELPAAAKAQIDDLIAKLTADPNGAYFEIEGHTDNVGAKDVNQKLGLDRAEAVKKYLYEQYHIPLFRMNVISYGQDKPVAPNTTKDGRAQNRRVVIRVLA